MAESESSKAPGVLDPWPLNSQIMGAPVAGARSPSFDELFERSSDRVVSALVVHRMPDECVASGSRRSKGRRNQFLDQTQSANKDAQSRFATLFSKVAARGRRRSAPDLKLDRIGKQVLPVMRADLNRRTLENIEGAADVVTVLPDHRIHLIEPTRVAPGELRRHELKAKITWGLRRLGIPSLWGHTLGRNARVAVLDSGLHGAHPVFGRRARDFVLIDPVGRRITTNQPFDTGSHGTHVAGTVAGGLTENDVAIGVAPDATVLGAAVLFGQATLGTIFEGMAWAVENNADVINMSFGSGRYEPNVEVVLRDLIDRFNVVPVVAIGNANHGNTSSPGNAPSALAVGALEKQPGARMNVASFSSGASLVLNVGGTAGVVTKPDVSAPGAQIYSSIPPVQTRNGVQQYAYMDGTSMAAPHVAGVAALLASAFPRAHARELMRALALTARHPGAAGAAAPDNRWGMGMIDPVAAFEALRS